MNKNSPFILEPYHGISSRYTCPECKEPHCFVRYVDLQGNHVFPYDVGRCNRENKCGYFYSYRMYFRDNPDEEKAFRSKLGGYNVFCNVDNRFPKVCTTKVTPSFIEKSDMQATMCNYNNNNFFLFLEYLVGKENALRMIGRYHVGTSDRWSGATIFWQVDEKGMVHHGKIMNYNFITGKREKNKFSTYECHKQLPNFHLEQCFFGEHLLIDKEKPVALVESEKTAIIAAEYMPDFIWLASGGSNGCLNQRMKVLADRNVVLFPDLKQTEAWELKAALIRSVGARKVVVSHYIEDHATDEERKAGLDIADYLITDMKHKSIQEMRFD